MLTARLPAMGAAAQRCRYLFTLRQAIKERHEIVMAVWPGDLPAPEMNEIRRVPPEPAKKHCFLGFLFVLFCLMSPVTSGSELQT